jgi:FMN phosphatase YigB (HAD superfamily)
MQRGHVAPPVRQPPPQRVVDPAECLFVDDDPALVSAAVDLGYRGIALVRDGRPPGRAGAIGSLHEMLPIVPEP